MLESDSNSVPCPIGCPNLRLKVAHKKTRETLNNVELKCRFAPRCDEIVLYGELATHEFYCEFN